MLLSDHSDPHQARVNVPDERFNWLCQLFKPKSEVPAYLEIVDIAGLVRWGTSLFPACPHLLLALNADLSCLQPT